jgi:DNA topoisomerase IA
VKVVALQAVHGRTADGRTWSVMDGTETSIDDSDSNLVALVKVLAEQGLLKVVKKPPAEKHDEIEPPAEPEEKPSVKEATVKPSATTKPSASTRGSAGRR